ncbi:unnamed protein product, partial [Citrullus colocynthis]
CEVLRVGLCSTMMVKRRSPIRNKGTSGLGLRSCENPQISFLLSEGRKLMIDSMAAIGKMLVSDGDMVVAEAVKSHLNQLKMVQVTTEAARKKLYETV